MQEPCIFILIILQPYEMLIASVRLQGGGIPVIAPELVRSAQAGDRDALITLLREIESHVYRTAYYILNNEQDALDASQEALLRIYTKINSYEEKALVQNVGTADCYEHLH